MRIGRYITIFIAGCLLLAFIITQWTSSSSFSQKEMERDQKQTIKLLSQNRFDEAINLVLKYRDQIDANTKQGRQWLLLLIKTSEQKKDTQRLLALYQQYPQVFQNREEASLNAANGMLATRQLTEYEALRTRWKNREKRKDVWLLLDADNLSLQGKDREAIKLLTSTTLEGKKDIGRLLRLGALYGKQQPNRAWETFEKAYTLNPQNPYVRSYRAKLLEKTGNINVAHGEYLAAQQTEPQNPYLKDQLAEFYLRNKQYSRALNVLSQSLTPPSLDILWLKGLFWGAMIAPVTFDWHAGSPPEGHLKPLIEYLITLKPDVFWNEQSFAKISNGTTFIETQQTTYWLRFLSALQKGNKQQASDLLQYNSFSKTSWDSELENIFKKIFTYRIQTGDKQKSKRTFHQKQTIRIDTISDDFNHALQSHNISPELHALLINDEAFAVALMLHGWTEAGLKLHTLSNLSNDFPEWVAYVITQALRKNRSNQEALTFAENQKQTPILSLAVGEILLALGQNDEAEQKLIPLTKENSDLGYRVSWILSLHYMKQNQLDKAREMIHHHPTLSKNTLGKELLARIALLENKPEITNTVYQSIEKDSWEAKSYLAQRAFEQKNWKLAEKLTRELLKQYPENRILHQNLQTIKQKVNNHEMK